MASGSRRDRSVRVQARILPCSRATFRRHLEVDCGPCQQFRGYIFIGIANGTLAVEGLPDERFEKADPAEINRVLVGALDPVPKVRSSVIAVGGRKIGVLHVSKQETPPVIAIKNIAQDVKEGTIYYRYVGETRAIRPGELRRIIAEREQKAVAEFSRRMARIAEGVEATVNLDMGEVAGKSGRFIIDKSLLPELQFVREGDFTERRGAPALRLIGEVEPIDVSERERVRVVRESVTPDAIVRNFLRGEKVEHPLEYIRAQAHCQRRWLPVWYYVEKVGKPLDELIEDLRSEVASHPATRDFLVQRLIGAERAQRVQVGKVGKLCREIARGKFTPPVDRATDQAFANAVMGLPAGTLDVERFKPILLESLDRVETGSDGAARSAIYRAVCRLDELLHRKA